jgi:hypothetical protein
VVPLRFDVAGWPRVAPHARRLSTRFRGSAQAVAGWEWPAGRRPVFSEMPGEIALRRGAVARQTGTSRFVADTAFDVAERGARPGLAVTGSERNAVGIELRGARAVAWRSVGGRRRVIGRLRLPPGRPVAGEGRVRLRLAVGRQVRPAIRFRGRWRAVGRPLPPPRWASGARVALSVTGRHRAVRFEEPAVSPR